jgi:hypothetical protein
VGSRSRPPACALDANAGDDEHGSRHGRRVAWSKLLARVFQVDVEECPAGGGRLKIVTALTDPASVRPIPGGRGPAIPSAAGGAGAAR